MGISATVPYPFDVILNGDGYLLADREEQKAAFGLTPIFVPRTNTQGDYGDNQQDFWLTWTQKDWSKGEQQKYQGRDEEGQSRYWMADSVDVRTRGEVTQRKSVTGITLAANPASAIGMGKSDLAYVTTATTLYHVDYAGTITSDGVHGLGTTPARFGMAWDGNNVFISTGSAGTVGIRRWSGAAFSTFSATSADSLAFLNNALYGYNEATFQLNRYDPTTGTATALFNWKDAVAGGILATTTKLLPFGGKLLILRYRVGGARGAELWIYDGSGTSKLTEFPSNFNAYDMEVLNGAVFVSGAFEKHVSATIYQRGAIYFYKDGQQDILWQADDFVSSATAQSSLAVYDGGLVWHNASSGEIMFYDPTLGGVHSIAGQSVSSPLILPAAATFFLVLQPLSTTAVLYPASSAPVSSYITMSLVDFNTSLRKIFRGVRVEFDAATDGDGGSVDIKYAFNTLGPTYTTLQTSAASGTEYAFPTPAEGTTYQSVSMQVFLNKGTSTNGPKLKRVQVRAIAVQPAFKKRKYVLALGGRDGDSPQKLRDGTLHNLDGLQMATNLQATASKTAPFTIQDHLSTAGFTGVIEELSMIEVKPEQFLATVTVRQV